MRSTISAKLKKSSFFLDNSVFLSLSLISAALNYVYYPVIARLLPPTQFGEAQVFVAILLQVSAVFSGLNLVVVYLVHRLGKAGSRQMIETLQKITVALFLLLTIGLLVAQASVLSFLQIDTPIYLFIVALDLMSNIPFILSFGYLQASKQFVSAGMLQISVVTTKLVLGSLMTLWLGVSGALLGFTLGQVIGMVLFWLSYRLRGKVAWDHQILRSLRLPARADLQQLRPYAWQIVAIFGVNVLLIFSISFDILASRHYFSSHLSGLYAGASTLSNSIIFVCLPLIGVLLPHLDITNFKNSFGQFSKTLGLVIAAGLSATFLLWLVPKPLLAIFGNDYTQLANLLWRLGLLMSLLSLTCLLTQVCAFYRPLGAFITTCLGLLATAWLVSLNNTTPVQLVSTISFGFAIMALVSTGQLLHIYGNSKTITT